MTVIGLLVHISTDEQWQTALAAGVISPDSLARQGFVHLSTPEQVHLPANRLYAGRADLVLLCIDPNRLDSEVRWEPGVPGDPEAVRFPHLYGPLPADAVVAVAGYLPGADGTFGVPDLGMG